MTNLLNPYRFAVVGDQLPAGAIAYANFLTSYFYAGGAETTAAAMFDLFKPARHEALGYLVDWNIDYEGLDAKGAFLTDLNTAAPNGLTIVMEVDTEFAPTVEFWAVFEGVDMDSGDYYVAPGANTGFNKEGRTYDQDTTFITGPTFEIIGEHAITGNYINRIAAVAGRDEGGGNYGIAMSVNGNTTFGDANTGHGGGTFVIDGAHFGGIPEFYVALGPDAFIREIILYPSKTDSELEALSTL